MSLPSKIDMPLQIACGQFEQTLISSLLPTSLLQPTPNEDDDEAAPRLDTAEAALFTQALAAALERAGGIGLGHELYHWLTEERR